jgi:hypothetical protein
MHMIVRSAVPLMDAALERAHQLRVDDDVSTQLIPYLMRHRKEEMGHDTWLLEDLQATGVDANQFMRQVPSPTIAALVGAQYYWLRHHHPVTLLGHMAAIEGYHPPAGFANRLRDLTGYPADAFRAIRRHETLDIYHKRELYELLDHLPLRAEHEKAIGMSGLHTIGAGIDVLAELAAAHGERQAEHGQRAIS